MKINRIIFLEELIKICVRVSILKARFKPKTPEYYNGELNIAPHCNVPYELGSYFSV